LKELLIFDLDGTLINSVPDLATSINFMLKSLNRDTFSEEFYDNNNGLEYVQKPWNSKLNQWSDTSIYSKKDILGNETYMIHSNWNYEKNEYTRQGEKLIIEYNDSRKPIGLPPY